MADGITHGSFGVSNDLVDAMNKRLDASTAGYQQKAQRNAKPPRQPQARSLQATKSVPAIENPLMCIVTGSTLLWELKSGAEPVYPVYVKDSFLNTNPFFDAGSFKYVFLRLLLVVHTLQGNRKKIYWHSKSYECDYVTLFYRSLQIEMESGAPLVLFGYTFSKPGVAVFASNRDPNRLAILNVVDDRTQCGSMNPVLPYPATRELLNNLPVSLSDHSLHGSFDWTEFIVTLAISFLLVFGVIGLQYLVRKKFWTFAPPLRVEQPDELQEAQDIT